MKICEINFYLNSHALVTSCGKKFEDTKGIIILEALPRRIILVYYLFGF